MSLSSNSSMGQAQKMMVFVLSMSIYGIATLFTELIPSFHVGIVEFSVEYFLFIPLSLAMLLSPLSAALGAATGELVFSEIMLGQFGGLGEVEKFLTVTIGVYVAGRMVRNPLDRKMVGFAAIFGVILQQGMGCIVDILKVVLAVEDFEAVPGLPESVFFTEGFSFLNDVLFSGILFCMLPTMYLVPKLYGKIEPLLGMKPRDEKTAFGGERLFTPKVAVLSILGFSAAALFEILSESGFELVDWKADWAESGPAYAAGIFIGFIILAASIAAIKRNFESSKRGAGQ